MSGITLVEVGPRDGLQNEERIVPTSEKIRFIDALTEAGHRRIEASAFVLAPRIPQLADAEEVLDGIRRDARCRYSALVPNRKGLERALEGGVEEAAVFTAASETFNRRNINAGIEESFARFDEVFAICKERAIPVRGYLSTVVWCPYEGRVPVREVVPLVERLLDEGCYEVSLGETIGRATPGEVRELCSALIAGGLLDRCAGHFHDTYGMGIANLLVALEAGIRVFDASAGGLGGCPYAPGAAGNVATEDVIWLCRGLGVDTGVDLDRQVAAARLIQESLGRPLPGRCYQAWAASCEPRDEGASGGAG